MILLVSPLFLSFFERKKVCVCVLIVRNMAEAWNLSLTERKKDREGHRGEGTERYTHGFRETALLYSSWAAPDSGLGGGEEPDIRETAQTPGTFSREQVPVKS